ncbi:MAG: uncharacterized protein A8A55_0242 [Amphiamblys sp. WSBS2006]|nr:MAG: uncharacterized protein A8A55_0242 [Amphiamblys sp. WSBS2006]
MVIKNPKLPTEENYEEMLNTIVKNGTLDKIDKMDKMEKMDKMDKLGKQGKLDKLDKDEKNPEQRNLDETMEILLLDAPRPPEIKKTPAATTPKKRKRTGRPPRFGVPIKETKQKPEAQEEELSSFATFFRKNLENNFR